MKKEKNISARVTETEYNDIIRLAKKNSLSLSDYIVRCCLSQQLNQNIMHTMAIILDMKKLLKKLENGVIKKNDYIKGIKEVLRRNGSL